MNKNTRWVAKWIDPGGRARTWTFNGPETLFLARLDFQFQLLDQGEKIPNEFELEEYPRRREQNWNSPGEEETLEMPAVSHRPTRSQTCEERTVSPGRE